MIKPKSSEELARMQAGGKKLGAILTSLLDLAEPGVSLLDIEKKAMKDISEAGGLPSFTTVRGYQWATCLCVNEEVVHGIPRKYVLKEQDILTIDIGMIYLGLHTDTAWTKFISKTPSSIDRKTEIFLQTGEMALARAISQAQVGHRVGDISNTIESCIEGAGFKVIRMLVGHGVGRSLHEDPQIPGYSKTPTEKTPLLTEGMTIAIEVIYSQGSRGVAYANNDGWTLSSDDGSLSAVFEHSVEIRKSGPLVLTAR